MSESRLIALAGNPNAGKTTMFNALTGARQHVGNYPGITVEKKEGFVRAGEVDLHIVDLPGTYSLTAYSQEELVARNFLVEERPDLVVDVLNAGALERNLYLAVQFMELGIPMVLALNMVDEAKRKGMDIDTGLLSRKLGVPVVETVARSGVGKEAL
ncbi:MAG: FeoB small GTPase domain-containing protein, partial [Desulfovibrionales bacterium]